MKSNRLRLWAVTLTAAALTSFALPVCSEGQDESTRVRAATLRTNCQADQNRVIASAGPVSLSEGSLSVSLVPLVARTVQGGSLPACLNTLGPQGRVYLVVRGMRSARQPGVLFHLYLDLPNGEKPKPGKRDPRYIGTLNFYDATDDDRGPQASDEAPFISFNITGLAKGLQAEGLLREETTITITSSGSLSPDSKPQFSAIELIVQRDQS